MNAERYLLTPGPLTTSAATRAAMQRRDWGSRDGDFIALTRRVRERLCRLAGAERTHACVLLQGSGTFAVEAAVQTLLPRDGTLLVVINGAYGRRMAEIARRLGRRVSVLDLSEERPVDPAEVAARLDREPDITHVGLIHCETTSGVLNPAAAVAAEVARRGKALLLDAISSFGAVPVDAASPSAPVTALIASANKCLEGAPGIGIVIAATEALAAAEGNASSLSLDLYDQWQGFERNGQWRFTPPTHVLAALDAALDQHEAEGGVAARGARYAGNCRALLAGMRRLGFSSILADEDQSPIIATFDRPPNLDFETFYDRLADRGFVIYPGKVTRRDTFRIGCIGAIDETVIAKALAAIEETLREMRVDPRATLRLAGE